MAWHDKLMKDFGFAIEVARQLRTPSVNLLDIDSPFAQRDAHVSQGAGSKVVNSDSAE